MNIAKKVLDRIMSVIRDIIAYAPWGIIIAVVCLCNLGWTTWTKTFPTVSSMSALFALIVLLVVVAAEGLANAYRKFEHRKMTDTITSQHKALMTMKTENENLVNTLQEARQVRGQSGSVRSVPSEGGRFQVVDDTGITLDDVRGMPETLKDIQEVITVLNKTEDLKAIGGTAPSGLLLAGEPGTGKTLIAKAIAGTCGMSFIPVCGSEFMEKYVGVGPERVRSLFNYARSLVKQGKKVIIFFDEIDALAAARGSDENSEKDATINQLLTELDGFNDRTNIFVIAATNRADLLDEAVTRPGRFDRTITIPMPDKKAREDILSFYMKGYRIGDDVELSKLVSRTVGFSPADLRNLLNTAAVSAVCDDKKFLTSDYLDEAYWKIIMKGNKRERDADEEEDRLVAYHEAGHAVINTLLAGEEVTEVTIIGSTSGAGGVTILAPKEQLVRSAEHIRNRIKGMYGGRAAEEILLGNTRLTTTGASADIHSASEYIRMYIEKWGMSDKDGLLDYSVFKKDGESLETAQALSTELYQETVEFLREHHDDLVRLAEELLAKKTLDGDRVREILYQKPAVAGTTV